MRVGLEAAAAFALLASGCGLGRGVYAVDRVEEGKAVLVDEHGETMTVEAADLPGRPVEGDVLVDFKADERERERLLFDIRERRGRLLQRSGGGGGTGGAGAGAGAGGDLSLEAP